MPAHARADTDERSETTGATATESNSRLRQGTSLIALAGVLFVLHGIGFLYRTYYTDGFELGVATLDGVTADELAATHPEVASYITHVHVSFAGLMIAAGLGVTAIAWFGIRRGDRWALGAALMVPLVFAGFTLPVHQTVRFDFDFLLHLGPAAIGLPLLLAGGFLAALGYRELADGTTRGKGSLADD